MLYPFATQVGRAGCTLLLLPAAAYTWDPVSLGHFMTYTAVAVALTLVIDRGFSAAGYFVLSLAGTPRRSSIMGILRRRMRVTAVVVLAAGVISVVVPDFAWFIMGAALFAIAGGTSLSFLLNFQRRGLLFFASELATPASLLVAPIWALASGAGAGECFLVASLVAIVWNALVVWAALRGVSSAGDDQPPAAEEVEALDRARMVQLASMLGFSYTFASVPLATSLHGAVVGGMVGLAERTNGLLALMVRPVAVSLAGATARQGTGNAPRALRRVRRACYGLTALWLAYVVVIIVFYDSVGRYIFGSANLVPREYMLIFAVAYLFSAINTFLAAGYLAPLGDFRTTLQSAGFGAVTFVAGAVALQGFGPMSVGIARLLAEVVVLAIVLVQIRKVAFPKRRS
jgi:hypothetical protein